MKIAFFEIEQKEVEYIKEQLPGADIFFSDQKLSKENLPQEKDFDAVSVFVGSKIDADVIAAFPNVKLITTRSTGFDHIDLKFAAGKGIKTGYVPGYGDNTVAEFAFGLILNLSRKMYLAIDRIKETENFNYEGLKGFDLKEKTIGVVGTGRIGQYAIKIAKGFGMNVIAYDAFPKEELAKELDFKYVSFDDLLTQADVIDIHVPYLPTTHHMINMENIGKIKKGAILINTARGAIVETDALVKALNEGILGGAGMDVLEEEGVVQDEKAFLLYGHPEEHNLKTVLENHVLMEMPNVLITPHTAFNTAEAIQRILDTDLINIKEFIQNRNTKFPIPCDI
jgi:D-lactate dehydrogenase